MRAELATKALTCLIRAGPNANVSRLERYQAGWNLWGFRLGPDL